VILRSRLREDATHPEPHIRVVSLEKIIQEQCTHEHNEPEEASCPSFSDDFELVGFYHKKN
jgi:hypothetical protein